MAMKSLLLSAEASTAPSPVMSIERDAEQHPRPRVIAAQRVAAAPSATSHRRGLAGALSRPSQSGNGNVAKEPPIAALFVLVITASRLMIATASIDALTRPSDLIVGGMLITSSFC